MEQPFQDRGSASVEAYLGQWLTQREPGCAPYQGYEGLIRLYAIPAVGQMGLGELRPLHLTLGGTPDEESSACLH